jgi:hypothetical protein
MATRHTQAGAAHALAKPRTLTAHISSARHVACRGPKVEAYLKLNDPASTAYDLTFCCRPAGLAWRRAAWLNSLHTRAFAVQHTYLLSCSWTARLSEHGHHIHSFIYQHCRALHTCASTARAGCCMLHAPATSSLILASWSERGLGVRQHALRRVACLL